MLLIVSLIVQLTPLMEAAANGHVDVVKFLLQANADLKMVCRASDRVRNTHSGSTCVR